MNVKLYGAAGQKKLAEYPTRIMQAQKLQDDIPKIEELNLDETGNSHERLKRFYKELCAYEVAMRAVASCYRSIIQEATEDCAKLENLAMNAPPGTKEERKFSLTTSIVQTRQQIVFAEQQCTSLEEQVLNIEATKAALKMAITQNELANLAPLCAQLKQRDTEIRNSPK